MVTFSSNNFADMTLAYFLEQFDYPGSIVLLEGKRNVIPNDSKLLTDLGNLLTQKSQHIIFRSGNASGSDQLFSEGVIAIDQSRLQVITPYSGHRQKTNHAYDTFALDKIDLAAESEVVNQFKQNKKLNNMMDQYLSGEKNRIAMKAAYLIRDTIKVLGTSEIPKATFGIFYDDLAAPMAGGTGHTMYTCQDNYVPFIDQRIWMNWI